LFLALPLFDECVAVLMGFNTPMKSFAATADDDDFALGYQSFQMPRT
jgi:hypothetical protein